MGQRHQIYIRIPEKFYGAGNVNNQPETTIGFHHQWLYGATALQVLDNFLKFYSKSMMNAYAPLSKDRVANIQETAEICKTVLSYFPETGIVERLHLLEHGETNDPHFGDNNDGITVIDLCSDNPKYCFYSLGHTEGEKSLDEGIYSAEQYLESYWPRDTWREVEGRNGGLVLGGLLDRLNSLEVLNQKRLYEIFPGLKERHENKAA